MSTYSTYPVDFSGLVTRCCFHRCSRDRDRLHGELLKDMSGKNSVEVREFLSIEEARKHLEFLTRAKNAMVRVRNQVVLEHVRVAESCVSRVDCVPRRFLAFTRRPRIQKETPVLVQKIPQAKKRRERTFQLCEHHHGYQQALPAILSEFVKVLEQDIRLGRELLKICSLSTVQVGGTYYVKALRLCPRSPSPVDVTLSSAPILEGARLWPTAPLDSCIVVNESLSSKPSSDGTSSLQALFAS